MAKSGLKLIPEDTLEIAVTILKAVAHPLRLQIVNILLSRECQVGELVKVLGSKQSITSQELSILRFSGILKSRKYWNKVYYSIANDSIKKIMESIIAEI
ncbi:ArsR/SmtB family transcription factor [Candidatus Latescibacterota bacterium]